MQYIKIIVSAVSSFIAFLYIDPFKKINEVSFFKRESGVKLDINQGVKDLLCLEDLKLENTKLLNENLKLHKEINLLGSNLEIIKSDLANKISSFSWNINLNLSISAVLIVFIITIIYKYSKLKQISKFLISNTKKLNETLSDCSKTTIEMSKHFKILKDQTIAIHKDLNKANSELKETVTGISEDSKNLLKNSIKKTFDNSLKKSLPILLKEEISKKDKIIASYEKRNRDFLEKIHKKYFIKRDFEIYKKKAAFVFYNGLFAATALALIKIGMLEPFVQNFVQGINQEDVFLQASNDPFFKITDFKLRDPSTKFNSNELNFEILEIDEYSSKYKDKLNKKILKFLLFSKKNSLIW